MLRKLLFVLVSLFTAPMTLHADVMVGGITVSSPGASVGAVSVADYTARWWQYVLQTRQATNPDLDPNGSLFNAGPYVGDGVTFLFTMADTYPPDTGTTNQWTVTRTVSVHPGTDLLVPLIPWVNIATDPTDTADSLLAVLDYLIAGPDGGTSNLFAKIDGVDFATATGLDLLNYRETFGRPGDSTFGVVFPATDAMFGLDGLTSDLLVADGNWLLLKDLPVGPHTVEFGGTNFFGERFDITYNLTVPEPGTLALLGLGLAGLGFARRKA
jgi:hypothetical protein